MVTKRHCYKNVRYLFVLYSQLQPCFSLFTFTYSAIQKWKSVVDHESRWFLKDILFIPAL